jgi:hypothetical protein
MCTDTARLGVLARLNKRHVALVRGANVKGCFGSPPRYPYNARSSLAIRIPT